MCPGVFSDCRSPKGSTVDLSLKLRRSLDSAEYETHFDRPVSRFIEIHGRPIAVTTTQEADVVRGRTITSWPSLKTDLRNAGATWVDEEVVVDAGLTSSRNPGDLPAYCNKLIEEFAEGQHEGQRRSA